MEGRGAEDTSRYAWPTLLVITLAGFGILKLFANGYVDADDNIYLYLAERMSEGAIPYRDFFHAHPPLHLPPMALVYALGGGFSLLAARLFSGAVVCLTAIALYRLVERRSAGEAWLACLLFLFSFDLLRLSTHFTGSNLAALWMAIGLERLAKRRDTTAAIAFVLGGLTLPTAAPAAVGAAAVVFLRDRRRGLRLALFGGGLFLVGNLIAVGIFGVAFLDQVYLFHLGKAASRAENLTVFAAVLVNQRWLVAGALLGLFALLLGSESTPDAESRPESDPMLPVQLSIGSAAASLLFLSLSSRVFVYYFEVAILCLAPLAAFGIASLLRALRLAVRAPSGEHLVAAGTLLVVFIASQIPATNLLRKHDPMAEVHHHSWAGSGFALLDAPMERFFLGGEQRLGRAYPALTRYLWHEADVFDSAVLLADEVRNVCEEEQVIFGDSTSAPLVALLADRRLFEDMADTNRMRFVAQPERVEELILALEGAPPCAIVYRERHGLFHLPQLRSWLAESHDSVLQTQDAEGRRSYQLFVPRTGDRS